MHNRTHSSILRRLLLGGHVLVFASTAAGVLLLRLPAKAETSSQVTNTARPTSAATTNASQTHSFMLNRNNISSHFLANPGGGQEGRRTHKESVHDIPSTLIIAQSSNAKYYSKRGGEKFKQGDIEGALTDFNKAIAIDPTYARAYRNRGAVKYKLGDSKGACNDYKKAAALGHIESRIYLAKGVVRDLCIKAGIQPDPTSSKTKKGDNQLHPMSGEAMDEAIRNPRSPYNLLNEQIKRQRERQERMRF